MTKMHINGFLKTPILQGQVHSSLLCGKNVCSCLGAMGRRIDPSWWTHLAISRSSQCSTTAVTKAVVCATLSGVMHIKEPLLLIRKSSPCGGSRFPLSLSEWSFTICLTTYNRK